MIKSVIRLQNDIVMVFNTEGKHMPEYQGRYEEVKGSILRDVLSKAVFARRFSYDTELETVFREEW